MIIKCGSLVGSMVMLCLGIGLCILPVTAYSATTQPFGIAKFTMQTTGPTKEIQLASQNSFEFVNEAEDFTQAGGHPWALTTTVEFTSEEIPSKTGERMLLVPTRDPKDVVVGLPPGLLGDPLATPRCPLSDILGGGPRCPASTQVGVYRIRWQGGKEALAPIVNVTPESGQSAEFAFENEIKITPILTAHLVRTAQGLLGFTVDSNEIPEAEISRVETTFWGVPADPSHNEMRGLFCGSSVPNEALTCAKREARPANVPQVAFLTMPTDCSAGPQAATLRADSWQEPGQVYENQHFSGYVEAQTIMPRVTECDSLSFTPTIEVEPETKLADTPSGLDVDLRVPQFLGPNQLSTPTLRDSLMTLPIGMSVNPSAVNGIKACSLYGLEGINLTGPDSEEVAPSGELQLAPGHCPNSSIVGTAEAITPFLPEPVRGHVYLAQPGCGGVGEAACSNEDAADGNLYKLYLELGGSGELATSGIQIKVAGRVDASPATGQLTAVFEDTPQAPFSDLKVDLDGGPQASLANSPQCGSATTSTDLRPWSAPGWTPLPEREFVTGTPDATPTSFFDVTGCAPSPGFAPEFLAGMTSPLAGQYSPFTLDLSRKDGEQYIKAIDVKTPPGLLGMLSTVPLCPEPSASLGTCPPQSRIGSTTVAAGAGSRPFEIGGDIYLSGPYDGAPFSLSVVTNVVAGPFNLGRVVVRAEIEVDSTDSTLTVATNEKGPGAIPGLIFGVPLRIQRIEVNIDRPGFMFNPTNCNAQKITAEVVGSAKSSVAEASPFAVGDCRHLTFKPKFTASTTGHTTRAAGASLLVKLSYPSGSVGTEANVARAKVDLPRKLPSRLSTLQKACTAAIFDSNPAACPAGSVVGIVRAHTPVLPVELSGPVYFVSHGGEGFPSLIIVLQGDGVRVDLRGTTFINEKTDVTSSTFTSLPDVPVSVFELYLPEGKNSALAANADLCAKSTELRMPTELVAQNGLTYKQLTKIAVVGCRKGRTSITVKRKKGSANRGRDVAAGVRRVGRSAL